MRPTKWLYYGDVNMLDYGGKFWRQVGQRAFQFIDFTNMDDACGRDNEGMPKYAVSLALVDLDAIDPATQDQAWKSCGWNDGEFTATHDGHEIDNAARNARTAEACFEYGAHAPLWDQSGNNGHKLLKIARSEANSLLDSDSLSDRMSRPVNKLGSTAAEYMRGDFNSAMVRGVYAGKPDARIMAKINGVDQVTIDDVRPDDYLPYVMGYMAAFSGIPKQESTPDEPIVPEYFQGYERGERVKRGECPAPSWIK